MCGEQRSVALVFRYRLGSPPRVRGTAGLKVVSKDESGITPACAGNRRVHQAGRIHTWDHPRVCGEQLENRASFPAGAGSPPRVRGTVIAIVKAVPQIGITPACAGNRLFLPLRKASERDHPRVCGEQTKKSPSFLHSFLSDQENSFSLKYNCSISSQSFCARWTSLQGSSKCFAKVDS